MTVLGNGRNDEGWEQAEGLFSSDTAEQAVHTAPHSCV